MQQCLRSVTRIEMQRTIATATIRESPTSLGDCFSPQSLVCSGLTTTTVYRQVDLRQNSGCRNTGCALITSGSGELASLSRQKLVQGITITFQEAQEAFQNDFTSRVEEIEREIKKLEVNDDADLDEGLKRAEFSETHAHEQFSEKLRELNYRIVAGDTKSVDARKYRAAQNSANRKMEKELTNFVPVCSVKLFLKKLKSTTTLKTVKDVSSLLYAYQDLDAKLTKFEDSVEQLAIAIERAIEREIDIRRGK